MRCLFFIFCFNCFLSFSQNTDEKLAAQYFNDKKYQEAADLYEKLASKQLESVYYYDNLLQCYVLLNDFDCSNTRTQNPFAYCENISRPSALQTYEKCNISK